MTAHPTESVPPPLSSWPRAARTAAAIAAGLALVLVVALLATIFTVRASYPETGGTLRVSGLDAPVDVRRDQLGIPQLYAESPGDLFFAQGFVQAQDRFYEMDFKRHLTAGRLSELLGRSGLEADQFLRVLDWRGVAEREWPMLSTQTRDHLTSFANGVNAYLADRDAENLSLEYVVLGLGGLDYVPEKWSPIDSLAWLKAMAWDLRGNMQDEIDRALLAVRLTPAQIAELYPAYPYAQHLPIIPGETGHGTGADAAGATTGGDGIGSNSWVVGGSHTTSGKPLLANDPHLSVSQPGIWYQMGLHCRRVDSACPYDVSGFTLAGMPGVVIGHNAQVAWGFTNLGPDVSDLYLEKLQGKSWLSGTTWKPLAERDEVIRIKGAKSKTITVRATDHGPVLSDVSRELSTVGANATVPPGSPARGNGYAVSLAWTGLIPSTTADAVFMLNQARDWEEFRAAASKFAVPSQNLVYADTEGNIGYQAPGMIPIRRPGQHGDRPAPGWDPGTRWSGTFVDFADMPHELNPAEGFIVTANQAVTGVDSNGKVSGAHLGDDWDRGYRSQRIRDLLSARFATAGGSHDTPDGADKVDVEDMRRIQQDTVNPMAATLVPRLLKIPLFGLFYSQAQDLLREWDGSQPADSAAAAYFNSVWRHVIELTFADELGDRVEIGGGQRWMGVVEGLLKQPKSPWWDDVDTTEVVEDRDLILKRALREAREELTRRLALDPEAWQWGRLHRLELENQSLGQSGIGVIEALFNRGPWRVGGGSAAVDATNWDARNGYQVTSAPSMRMVVDLGDLDRSRWINLTGASGHAFHGNYSDQTDLWVKGESAPWPSSPGAVKRRANQLLVLEPEH